VRTVADARDGAVLDAEVVEATAEDMMLEEPAHRGGVDRRSEFRHLRIERE
jgi:hypothetical protein